MLLLLVFFFNAPSNSVGSQQPGLFLSVAVGYFAFGLVCIQTIQSRTPSAEWQAILQLVVDAIAISVLIHASGGVSSGLATLLVLPTGAAATILPRRYALLGTSFVALVAAGGDDDLVPAGRELPVGLPDHRADRSQPVCDHPARRAVRRRDCGRARRWRSSARSTSRTSTS